MSTPPRYAPDRSLPARAFVPGKSSIADRPAHDAPRRREIAYDDLALDEDFLHGVDLFNHGFPWEAHEIWEPLWFEAPRDAPARALLQGLIHAAAAAVKSLGGNSGAACGLVASACEHLARSGQPIGAGIKVADMIAALTAWAAHPLHATGAPPTIVVDRARA